MKRFNRALASLLVGVAAFFAASVASATGSPDESTYRDFSKMPVSGTVTFEVTSVKLLVGASWGEGILTYQGQDYPIKVKAASAGGVGARVMKGEGKVYALERLEDFAGIYTAGSAGVTIGTAGGGVATLENSKRVVIQAQVTDSDGVQLSLSAGGIQIKFADE